MPARRDSPLREFSLASRLVILRVEKWLAGRQATVDPRRITLYLDSGPAIEEYEIESNVGQYSHLWEVYVPASFCGLSQLDQYVKTLEVVINVSFEAFGLSSRERTSLMDLYMLNDDVENVQLGCAGARSEWSITREGKVFKAVDGALVKDDRFDDPALSASILRLQQAS